MTFDKGMVGVLIVILSLVASVGLGVITNVETKTVTKDVENYVADITGAFTSEKQQAYTDYNPAKNYNGYTSTNTSQFAIDFVPSANPNNFPIVYYTSTEKDTYDPEDLMDELSLTPDVVAQTYSNENILLNDHVGYNWYYKRIYNTISTAVADINGPGVATISKIPLSDVLNNMPNSADITQTTITIPIQQIYTMWSFEGNRIKVISAPCPDNYVYIWPTNKDESYNTTQLSDALDGKYGKGINAEVEYTFVYTASNNTGVLSINGTQLFSGPPSAYTLYWGKGFDIPGPVTEESLNHARYCYVRGAGEYNAGRETWYYSYQLKNSLTIENVYNKHTEYIDTRYGISPRGDYFTNEGDPAEDLLPLLSDYAEWDMTIGYDASGTTVQVISNGDNVYGYTASPSSTINIMGYSDTYGFYATPTSNRMDLITPTNMATEPASALIISKGNGGYDISKVYNNITTPIATSIAISNLFVSKDDGTRVFQANSGSGFEVGYDYDSDIYGIGFKSTDPANLTIWNDGEYHLIVGSGGSLYVMTDDWTISSAERIGYNILSSMSAEITGGTVVSTAQYVCAPQIAGIKETVVWNNGYENGVTDIVFSVWNEDAVDKFTSNGRSYSATGTLNYKDADPDTITVSRVGEYMYVSLNDGTPVNIGAWNQIQVTLDNIAGVIHVYPIQTWDNFNNYTISPTSVDIEGLKKANLTSISWKANNSLRLEVVGTQVFFNTYGVVMVDPQIEISKLWPNYVHYMVKISDVASIGTSIKIGNQNFPITNNTITMHSLQKDVDVKLDVTDLKLYYTLTERGWEVTAQSGKSNADTIVENSKLEFDGLWYFKAGFYKVDSESVKERSWNPITYNWYESNLFFWMAGIVLVFGILAFKMRYLDGMSILILIGTEIILVLIGGTT